jgi:hypothetical protein
MNPCRLHSLFEAISQKSAIGGARAHYAVSQFLADHWRDAERRARTACASDQAGPRSWGAEDRPLLRCAYFVFKMRRSGVTVSTDAILIPYSPPPARQPPAGRQGGRCQGKEILNAGALISVKDGPNGA